MTLPAGPLGHQLAAKIELSVPRVGILGKAVRAGFVRPEQMDDLMPARSEKIRHEQAMAAPGHGLGAHEAGGGLGESVVEGVLPFRSAHASCVASERGRSDAPEALLAGLAASASAELDCVAVGDACRGESLGEGVAIELRIAPRARIPADVDQGPGVGGLEALDELPDRPRPVPDCEHAHGESVSASPLG
jgi:hypothetical protein